MRAAVQCFTKLESAFNTITAGSAPRLPFVGSIGVARLISATETADSSSTSRGKGNDPFLR
jgi:hypothetical protein